MKQIIVPLSAEAMKKLDYDQADDDELYIVKLSEQEVNLLFEKNFFNRINEIIDTYIDDYEYEEIIDLRKLVILKNFLQDTSNQEWADIPPKIYQNILFLTKLAIAKQTDLFFFF
jgi:identified by metaGeneAnnotator